MAFVFNFRFFFVGICVGFVIIVRRLRVWVSIFVSGVIWLSTSSFLCLGMMRIIRIILVVFIVGVYG